MTEKGAENTGVILKIQKRSGCLLLVIGAAMLAFVLTDIISGMGSSLGAVDNSIGTIDGEEVDYTEYTAKVEELTNRRQRLNPNQEVSREEIENLAWEMMVNERIVEDEWEKLGIDVYADEFWEAALNNPEVRRAFSDSTQQFNPIGFRQFIDTRMQEDPNLLFIWKYGFEEPIINSIKIQKYKSLIDAGVYVTALDARADFEFNTLAKQAKVVGLPYLTVSDSAVDYTDEDLVNYMKEHKDEYEVDAFRNIEFAVMNIIPSAADTAVKVDWASKQKEKFAKAEDDSTFVTLYQSSTRWSGAYAAPGELDPQVEELVFNADSGEIFGPMISQGSVGLFKVSDIKNDSVAAIKARHVLMIVDGSTAADTISTMADARALMAKLRSGETTFETEALGNIDRTGSNGRGGDLGWMKDGVGYAMHPQVRDEIFKKNYRKGDMFVTKSNFGVHVVEVTENPTKKRVQVAVLSQPITFGSETNRNIESKANNIFFESTNEGGDFRTAVQDAGYNVNEATRITEQDKTISGIKDAKRVIKWLYNKDRKAGDISDPFFMEDQFVVVKVAKIVEEGLADLEDVRERVTEQYLNDKKGDILITRFEEQMKESSSLDEIAQAMNTDVRIVPNLTMQESAVTNVGADNIILGYIHGLPEEQISKPIKGANGVYIIYVVGEVKAGEVQPEFDLAASKRSVRDRVSGGSTEALATEALKDAFGVEDRRYKFF